MTNGPITYEQSGVNYANLDPLKIAAQNAARTTTANLAINFSYQEWPASRGESAFVWKEGDRSKAMVTEGLGTKNLVADAMYAANPKGPTYYGAIAQDTVAMIVNDLVTVGAMPEVVTAHWSVESANWFNDKKRVADLTSGWAKAVNEAGATWGGGETPALKGILLPGVIELSGTAVGEVDPAFHPVLGEQLRQDDVIIVLGSSGIHANGLTLAREVSDRLPEGYTTLLPDGRTYGEALLTPTYLYTSALQAMQGEGINPSYMANITGHGWRKFMRATKELTYRMFDIPMPQPEFKLIKRVSRNDDEEMYGNFNMGAGFAVYLPERLAANALSVVREVGFDANIMGVVEKGTKQVIIEPLGITYKEDAMHLR